MSLATTLFPKRLKKITNINLLTVDPSIGSPTYFLTDIFIPQKPCTVLSFRTKLLLENLMSANYDNSDPDNPTIWNQGIKVAFVVYRGNSITQDPIRFPDASTNGGNFWTSNEEDLIDYGWMKIETSNPYNLPTITSSYSGTITTTGTIIGPIAAPTGTGDIGPLTNNWNSNFSLDGVQSTFYVGGTTVDHYNNSGNLNIDMTGKGDYIRFVGIYPLFDHVNMGGTMKGTIELLIEY